MPDTSVDPVEVHGRRLALVLFDDEAGDEDEGIVIHGRGRWDGTNLRFEGKGREDLVFDVPEAALLELQLVLDDVRDMLADAEYWTLVPVGSLPEGVDPAELGLALSEPPGLESPPSPHDRRHQE